MNTSAGLGLLRLTMKLPDLAAQGVDPNQDVPDYKVWR